MLNQICIILQWGYYETKEIKYVTCKSVILFHDVLQHSGKPRIKMYPTKTHLTASTSKSNVSNLEKSNHFQYQNSFVCISWYAARSWTRYIKVGSSCLSDVHITWLRSQVCYMLPWSVSHSLSYCYWEVNLETSTSCRKQQGCPKAYWTWERQKKDCQ
jgi:hypothetical protein